MMKPFLIDSHQDLAFNIISFSRDYRRSAAETRQRERGGQTPQLNGDTLLGYPDYQQGNVALVFGTIFTAPIQHDYRNLNLQVYKSLKEARGMYQAQMDAYLRLVDESPDMFRLIRNRSDLSSLLKTWEGTPPNYPGHTCPTGILILMESAEGLERPEDLTEWVEAGVRVVGPVWGGSRFCGGSVEPGGFTAEGFRLLEVMASLGVILDISHMNERSSRQALDRYEGPVVATHANARTLLQADPRERQFSDETIRDLIKRDGVMGVIPFNLFLKSDWKQGDPRQDVTLQNLVAHIDHICQLAGNTRHAAIGTDFDGGFGYPDVPLEIDTIADIQKLVPLLKERGYNEEDIESVFNKNWRRILENHLPES